MGIDFRRADGDVAEHFLNGAEIDICIKERGGEGMAEHVRRDMKIDSGEGGTAVQHPADGLIREGTAMRIGKKEAAGGNFIFK